MWDFEVAIEHENVSGQWLDEWVKLAHVVAGLKVLISYHDYRKGDPGDVLDRAVQHYKAARYAPATTSTLIILGPDEWAHEWDFVAHAFDGQALSSLPNRQILRGITE